MAVAPADNLRLDRSQANLLFSSWRLSNSIARSEGSLTLPAPASPAQASDTDYVTARHAALLNGLTQQPAGCYTFLEESDAGAGAHLGLYQLDLGEPNWPPGLRQVCALPAQQAEGVPGGLASGRLPPSAVEVQAASIVPDSPAAAAADLGRNGGFGSSFMLVSSGCGDVSLTMKLPADSSQQLGATAAQAALSPAVHPLRPLPPLQGVRPVHLAAAFVLPGTAAAAGGGTAGVAELCCILWAARPRSERQASRCEVFAVHLAAGTGSPGPALRVLSAQLLKSSSLPPHGVLVNPATGGVLLALQPSSGGVEDEAATQRAAAAAAASTAAAGGKGSLPSDAMEEDDVSPRTLAAAVARLAAYTSEEPVGPLPHQQYADLYHETGPDGVGAMGSEPTCTLYTFALARGSSSSSGDSSAAAGAAEGRQPQQQSGQQQGGQQHSQGEQPGGQQQPLLRQVGSLSCQPHKLLTCHLQPPPFGAQEPPTPDTHLPPSSGGTGGGGSARLEPQQQPWAVGATGGGSSGAPYGHTLLLGLTDDVDCAVVSVSCSSSGTLAGGTSSGTIAGSGHGGVAAEGGGEEEAAGFVIRHVTSIPALAYVAAGKVQRKFLLLAPPGGDIAAALVEAGKYCYLYRATGQRQENGEHQVVDMELPDGSGQGLLGAVLTGARAGACRLLLLARDGLRVIDIPRRTACRPPAAGSSSSSSSIASRASSDLLTFAEAQAIAEARGVELYVRLLGLSYRIVCRDPSQPSASSIRGSSTLAREADEAAAGVGGSGRVLAVTSGFVVPPLGLMHCDILQVFTRGQRGEEGARTRGGMLGLGLLVGAATFAFGTANGCRKAEILAINDDPTQHNRLVAYYQRFGFQPVHVVRGGLADLPHMVVWGGAGTRMDADMVSMLRRWTPAVRRNSAAGAAAGAAGAAAAGAAAAGEKLEG